MEGDGPTAGDDDAVRRGRPPAGFALAYFARADGAASGARRLVVDALASWGVSVDRRTDAALVVSELVTNAVVHSRALDAEIEVTDLGESVRIVVLCSGEPPTGVVRPRTPAPSEPSGRGLAVVDALSLRWGVEGTPRGVRAWCELAAPRAERETPGPDDLSVPVPAAILRAFLSRSQLLLRLTEALTAAHTPDDVGTAVTDLVADRLGASYVGIAVAEPDTGTARYLDPDALGPQVRARWGRFALERDAPVAAAVREGRASFFETRAAAVAVHPDLADDLVAADVSAVAHLPLLVEGRAIGALAVAWRSGRVIDADERALLLTVAGYAAVALGRTLLAEHQLDVAAAVQRALLPQHLPSRTALRLAARYEPFATGAGVGGDWYDALQVPGGDVVLVVGDVAGHGIGASTVMAKLRYAARAHAVLGVGPAEVLTRVNTLLWHTRRGAVASMLHLQYDPVGRRATIASAGHLPALLVDRDGGMRYLDVEGVLLGVAEPARFPESRVDIPADAALVLFTDGLVEVRGDDLGHALARFAAVAGRQWSSSRDVDRLADRLVATRRANGTFQDDVCVLVATHPGGQGR